MQQSNAACLLLGRIELDIVFVDDEASLWIGLARGTVGEIEIVGSERFEKHRGAQTVRPPVLGFDRLVDDIPTVDPSAVATGQLPDVCDDSLLLLLAVRQ